MSPYITRDRRDALDQHLKPLRDAIWQSGDLAYALYSLCVSQVKPGSNYEKRRGILGDLEATKLEFHRNHLVKYEDEKRVQNGDVV